jgi:hypothetical protein
MPVPNTFGTATSAIPLSQLDANFATPITLGNTAIQLGNTVTTLNNMTLANVTISSGTITITNVAVTTANVSGTANISTLVVVGNETVGGNTTITGNITAANANVTSNLVLSGGTANGVAYLNTSKQVTTGTALVFDGTNLGIGVFPAQTLHVKTSTAATPITLGVLSNSTTLPALSFNGAYASSTMAGTYSLTGSLYTTVPAGAAHYFAVADSIKTTLDSSGNLGLGVTPSAQYSTVKAFQVGALGATIVTGQTVAGGTSSFGQNWYVDPTTANYFYAAASSQPATRYSQYAGNHQWFYASAGTAGNAITFTQAMTLTAGGALFVGTTAAQLDGSSKMVVLNSSATVAEFTASSGTATQAVLRSWNTATSGDNLFQTFHTDAGATQRGSIYYNRTGGLLVYLTTSDYRAKDISGPVIDSGSVIDSVPVYMGKMKDATQERPMFIAHETPAYAHVGEKDAIDADGKPVYQQMDASALVPVMWAEIQSLRKRLAAAGI